MLNLKIKQNAHTSWKSNFLRSTNTLNVIKHCKVVELYDFLCHFCFPFSTEQSYFVMVTWKARHFVPCYSRGKKYKSTKTVFLFDKIEICRNGKSWCAVFFHLNSMIFLSFRENGSASVEIVYQPWRNCCALITIQFYWIAIDRFESFSMCFHWTFSHSHLQWNEKKRENFA